MDLPNIIILAIVEGITEFLPVSSTGHLVLVSNILSTPQTEFVKTFEISIQLGAALAVAALYTKTLLQNKKLFKTILTAFIPSAVVGFILYRFIKDILIGNYAITLLALLVGGILLLIFERYYQEEEAKKLNLKDISTKDAFMIGLFQSVSVIPGVSRAAATILGGLFTGLTRSASVEFSFLLAIPTILGATILDLAKSNFAFSAPQYLTLATGFAVSWITATLVVKYFLHFIKGHTFVPFGVYRIVLSILYALFFLK